MRITIKLEKDDIRRGTKKGDSELHLEDFRLSSEEVRNADLIYYEGAVCTYVYKTRKQIILR